MVVVDIIVIIYGVILFIQGSLFKRHLFTLTLTIINSDYISHYHHHHH